MKLVILGAPRTKKNHGRRIKRGRRIFHVPSQACTDWTDAAVLQLRLALRNWSKPPFMNGETVNVRALIYRDANRGDAVGYYQAIADALQAAGVVQDDKLCVSWDGSRLLKDAKNPRVEITLEAAA
jgi:hypothetical protein